MGAVRLKTLADLRRRRLQSIGIALVLLLSTAAGTLALSILVESHAPFEHAFEAANGAHLVIRVRAAISTPASWRRPRHAAAVTASAGPWPVAAGAVGSPKGRRIVGGQFSGRPTPDPSIDNVTSQAGPVVAGARRGRPRPVDGAAARQAVGDTVTRLPVVVRDGRHRTSARPGRGPRRRRHRRFGQHARRRRLDEPDRRGGARPRRAAGARRCCTGWRRRPRPPT